MCVVNLKLSLASVGYGTGQGETNTGINDSNLDALASDSLSAQLVNLGHDMRAEFVYFPLGSRDQWGLAERSLLYILSSGNPLDLGVRAWDSVNGPEVLDGGQRSELVGRCLGLVGVCILQLNGNALEKLKVELEACVALGADGIAEGLGVLQP